MGFSLRTNTKKTVAVAKKNPAIDGVVAATAANRFQKVLRRPMKEWISGADIELYEPKDGSYYPGKIVKAKHIKFAAKRLFDAKNAKLENLRPLRSANETLDKLEEIPLVGSVVDIWYSEFDGSWWKGTVINLDEGALTIDVHHYDGTAVEGSVTKGITLDRVRWNNETQ
jgi:hypothetical protein